MIASKDEFLLLLTKWKNSSAKVCVCFVNGGSSTPNPLSSAFIVEVSGEIVGADPNDLYFVIGSKETGLVSVGFDGAQFMFETDTDLDPQFAAFVSASAKVDEMVSILLSSGLKLSLVTFK
jgi:hypothetical protein